MNQISSPKICIAGKNSIAVFALKKVVEIFGSNSVLVCPNKTDKGQSSWQPSLVRFAQELNVKIVSLEDLYMVENLIFISLEFDSIIEPHNFKSSKLFNIHFSKLPAYKGMYTSAWPILNGETESAVTLHKIDYGIDTGEIVDQLCFSLDSNETARTLYFKYLHHSETLFLKNLSAITTGTISSRMQKSVGSTYYSKKSINYNDLKIDTVQTAEVISRQIRAYSFKEFQLPDLDGFKIGNHNVTNNRSIGKVGSYIRNKYKIVISTIDYDVECYFDKNEKIFTLIQNLTTNELAKALTKDVNVDVTNSSGWTPLMIAAYYGNKQVIKLLLEKGAKTNLTNQNGTTALMYAKEECEKNEDFSAFEMLLNAGADVYHKDAFNKNILDYAKENNQVHTINYLNKWKNE